MEELVIIPKELAPRRKINYEQKIPKIIWQTFKTNEVPSIMKDYVDTWILKNPEYEYRFYDDEDVINFLKNYFPEYYEGYSMIKYGASKADLWRYLIMYKYGGVYADMDCRCKKPLRRWIKPGAGFVTQLGINKDICQWLLISEPGNPIFMRAAERSLENIITNNTTVSHHGFKLINNEILISDDTPLLNFNDNVLALAGPPVLQQVAEECYNEGSIKNILTNTQVTCVSDSTVSCQMNGNVTHGGKGNDKYKRALKLLKISHYNDFVSRIKRKINF